MADLPLVLIHHITTQDGLERMLAEAPTGAYRLKIEGLTVEKINDGQPPVVSNPAWGIKIGIPFSAEAKTALGLYYAPTDERAFRVIQPGYKFDVYEVRPDGWMRVTNPPVRAMWIKEPRLGI